MSWSFNIPFQVVKGEAMKTVVCATAKANTGAVYDWVASLGLTEDTWLVRAENSGRVQNQAMVLSFHNSLPKGTAIRWYQNAPYPGTIASGGTSVSVQISAGAKFCLIPMA